MGSRSRDSDETRSKAAEDVLFDMFKNEDNDLLPIGKFLAVSLLRCVSRKKNCGNYDLTFSFCIGSPTNWSS